MADEQKHEIKPLDYIDNIKKIELTNQDIIDVKNRLIENLNILFDSLDISMQTYDSHSLALNDYWQKFGHNYDLIPELSIIPHLKTATESYIRVTHKEKLLLVKGFIELLETVDKIKTKKTEERKEKQEKKEKADIDKKLDEMENQPKLKKGKPKKIPEIKEEDKEEFDKELESLEESDE